MAKYQTLLGAKLNRVIPGGMETVSKVLEAVENLFTASIDPQKIQVIEDLENIVNSTIKMVAQQTHKPEDNVYDDFVKEYNKLCAK